MPRKRKDRVGGNKNDRHQQGKDRLGVWRDRLEPTELDVALARDEICPKCLGCLSDTYICEECLFDALDVVIFPEMFP